MIPSQRPLADRPAESSEKDILTAVEEFLERTKDYQGETATHELSLAASSPPSRHAVPGKAEPIGTSRGFEHSLAPVDRAFANTQVMLVASPTDMPPPALPVVKSVTIHTPPSLHVPAAETPKTKTVNQALDMKAADTPALGDRLISHLKARAAETNSLESEWQLRLTQLALHRNAEAETVSPGLPEEARRMLTALVRAATAVWRTAQDPLLTGQEALARIDEFYEVVADRADPVIATVTLCHNVVTFGVYDEMNADAFVAGRTTQTIVYSEIRNFRSERTLEDRYRTQLGTRIEVLTAEGRTVWQHEEPEIADVCRRRRTDFFIAQRITLPPTLPAGDYVLKVFVEDKLSGRASEASHPLTLQSAMSVAGGF
jgi:hypothetical protein